MFTMETLAGHDNARCLWGAELSCFRLCYAQIAGVVKMAGPRLRVPAT